MLHFAARSLVGESVQHPEMYWQGNVVATLRLLEAIRRHGTPRLVFSSTAATYGEPEQVPIREDAPTRPTNPYGASKLAIDNMITSYAVAHGLAGVSLRYFNVAGAHGRFGERHVVETHLIPIVLQVASGDRKSMQIYGDDWPTPDGTCIRDYIHVDDLAEAHLLALAHAEPGKHAVYNLGIGHRLLGARGDRGLPRRDRAPDPDRGRAPPRRRPGRAGGLQRGGDRGARLAPRRAPTSPRSSATPGASPSSARAPDPATAEIIRPATPIRSTAGANARQSARLMRRVIDDACVDAPVATHHLGSEPGSAPGFDRRASAAAATGRARVRRSGSSAARSAGCRSPQGRAGSP